VADSLEACATGKEIKMSAIKYKRVDVDGFGVAYRDAGPVNGPALLLLHGFPTSSHMLRDLIPKLADRYRVVAPDLPGFGQSDLPSREQFKYSFSNLATVIGRFTEVLELPHFALYVFDYGAPTGLRMALDHPERVTAIITQNGNAYVEGLSDGWKPIRAYWKELTQANRDAMRTMLTPETTYWQYTTGVEDTSLVSPDGYSLDNYYMTRPGAHEVQLDLFLDYASNVDLYPKFQQYFREHQPPLLAVWGNRDPFFLPAGAEAFKRDIKHARVAFFDTGHFALETHCDAIAEAIREFLREVDRRAGRVATVGEA
jgi:pimeloyl-ACP methyl ester carboxylesterase